MPLTPYKEQGVEISEEFFETSDKVKLKVTSFSPPGGGHDRPVLVFVAGWISLLSGWHEVLMSVTPQYRVLYLETREKISAELPHYKVDFSVERMADDVAEAVEALLPAGTPYYFAGSSLGSTVVLENMSRTKKPPEAALLVGPIAKMHYPAPAFFIIRLLPAFLYFLVKPWLKWYLRNFRCDKKNEPEQVKKYEGTLDAAEPRRLKKNAIAIKNYSLWERLPAIESPVLIIGAKTDSLHGLESMEQIVEKLPKGRLAVLASNREAHSTACGELIRREMEQGENRS